MNRPLTLCEGASTAFVAGFEFRAEFVLVAEFGRMLGSVEVRRSLTKLGSQSKCHVHRGSNFREFSTERLGATSSTWRLWKCQLCAGLPQNTLQDFQDTKVYQELDLMIFDATSTTRSVEKHQASIGIWSKFTMPEPLFNWKFHLSPLSLLAFFLIFCPGWAFHPWSQSEDPKECWLGLSGKTCQHPFVSFVFCYANVGSCWIMLDHLMMSSRGAPWAVLKVWVRHGPGGALLIGSFLEGLWRSESCNIL